MKNSNTLLNIIATIVVMIFVYSVEAKAQADFHLPVMPSPTQASIAQYGEVPVSLQTGKINYQIPVHTISYKDLSVPIFLSYNVDGIKLDTPVPWTGTGWDLMAGGSINRVKKGNPDEWNNGYYNTGNTSSFLNFSDVVFNQFSCLTIEFEKGFNTCSSTLGNFLSDSLGSYTDTEQDIFYYNIGGESGKFIIESGNDYAYTIPKSNNKIQLDISANQINKIEIIKPNGVVYTFGDAANTQETVDDPVLDYTSTWYLTKIESPRGDQKISFVYGGSTQQDIFSFGLERHYTPSYPAGELNYDDDQITRYYYHKLTYIDTPMERISFGTESTGVNTGAAAYKASPVDRLKSISILSKPDLEVVKKIDFYHTVTSNDRLFLDSLKFSDSNSIEENKFVLEYYNKNELPGDRSNMGIDLWGFYNNKSNYNSSKQTYIPTQKFHLNAGNVLPESYNLIEGANRSVNIETVHYGALKKIRYPTGGYTSINYEPNEYSDFIYDPRFENLIILDTLSHREENLIDTFFSTGSMYLDFELSKIEYAAYFNYFEFSFHLTGSTCTGGFTVELYKENGSSDLLLDSWTNVIDDFSSSRANDENAEYYFKITSPTSLCNNDPVLISLSVDIFEEVIVNKKYGPGVRVSRTETYDGINSNASIIKRYIYGEEVNGEYFSHGVLFQEPNFHYSYPPENGYFNAYTLDPIMGVSEFWGIISVPVSSLGGGANDFLGYRKVKVVNGDTDTNGYEIHYYDITDYKNPELENALIKDYAEAPISNKWIFSSAPDLSYRIFEKSTEVYNGLGSLSHMSNHDNKFYDRLQDINEEKVFKKFAKVSLYEHSPNVKMYFWGFNYTFLQRPLLDSTIVFGENGDKLITTTEYDFDDFGIQQLRTTTETNSNGDVRKTEYTYAHEVYDGTGEMKDLNMLSQPYSVTVTEEDGTELSQNWTLWKPWAFTDSEGNPVSRWLPCGQWVWDGVETPTAPTSCTQN